jgi:AraC-like DNA-binding protein
MRAVRDGNEDFAVQRTRRFLDEHYAESVSLLDLARLTGLSPYYLHRSFCRKIGMPPHAYQVQVRVTRARSLLRRGRTISDAASSAGFVDQSHFSRHFKRLTGVTPGQFLQTEQERTRRCEPNALTSLA